MPFTWPWLCLSPDFYFVFHLTLTLTLSFTLLWHCPSPYLTLSLAWPWLLLSPDFDRVTHLTLILPITRLWLCLSSDLDSAYHLTLPLSGVFDFNSHLTLTFCHLKVTIWNITLTVSVAWPWLYLEPDLDFVLHMTLTISVAWPWLYLAHDLDFIWLLSSA